MLRVEPPLTTGTLPFLDAKWYQEQYSCLGRASYLSSGVLRVAVSPSSSSLLDPDMAIVITDDCNYSEPEVIETLFVEINIPNGKNIIVGLLLKEYFLMN